MLFHDFVKDFLMILKIPNTPSTRFSFSSKKFVHHNAWWGDIDISTD
jgi:hypothetical protein